MLTKICHFLTLLASLQVKERERERERERKRAKGVGSVGTVKEGKERRCGGRYSAVYAAHTKISMDMHT